MRGCIKSNPSRTRGVMLPVVCAMLNEKQILGITEETKNSPGRFSDEGVLESIGGLTKGSKKR